MRKEKLKQVIFKVFKYTSITLVICAFFAAMPYCGGILTPKTAGIITDSISASQVISVNSTSNIVVEFKCNGKEFAECLVTFMDSNPNLELRKIEDIPGEGLTSAKAFNVIFTYKNWAGSLSLSFFFKHFLLELF